MGAAPASASRTVRTADVQIKYATSSCTIRSGACRPRARLTTRAATAASASRACLPVLRLWRRREPPELGPLAVPRLRDGGRRHPARVVPRPGRRPAGALRQYPGAALQLPRCLRGRRVLRRGEPDDGIGRPPLPGARPVDDHGGLGQRAGQPRAPAGLRAGSGLLGGADLPVHRADVTAVATRGRATSSSRSPLSGPRLAARSLRGSSVWSSVEVR